MGRGVGAPASAGPTWDMTLLLGEDADQAGRAFGVAVERLDDFLARHAFFQGGRLEIGRDQREGVVMRRAWWRAGSEIIRQLHRALASDILVARLRDLAFGETD